MESEKKAQSNVQIELDYLINRRTLSSSTLSNLNQIFMNWQNERILQVLKKLPNDTYYQATLKLKKDIQQTPKSIRLKENINKLLKKFDTLKIPQCIKQFDYTCLDILKDISDQFMDFQKKQTKISEYRKCMIEILEYSLVDMSPQRFIKYILNHSKSDSLSSEQWQQLLFVKQKLYPPSEKILEQRKAQEKRKILQIKNIENSPQKQKKDSISNLSDTSIKNQLLNKVCQQNENDSKNNFINCDSVDQIQANFTNINNIQGASSNVSYDQRVNRENRENPQNREKTGQNANLPNSFQLQKQKIKQDQIRRNKIQFINKMKNDIKFNPNIIVQVHNNNESIDNSFSRRRSQSQQQLQQPEYFQNSDQQYEYYQRWFDQKCSQGQRQYQRQNQYQDYGNRWNRYQHYNEDSDDSD